MYIVDQAYFSNTDSSLPVIYPSLGSLPNATNPPSNGCKFDKQLSTSPPPPSSPSYPPPHTPPPPPP
ncbi:hypothetical protein QVD17_16842 [Tagetes erecta]|uniref:Uncharacterized protein n=1 Tax=Tagetes erecta TaxID=13708 RepID=A0AAD8KUT9_TARER|nr:hypothetical protein QVD17_16842 [Tagetes erecta]